MTRRAIGHAWVQLTLVRLVTGQACDLLHGVKCEANLSSVALRAVARFGFARVRIVARRTRGVTLTGMHRLVTRGARTRRKLRSVGRAPMTADAGAMTGLLARACELLGVALGASLRAFLEHEVVRLVTGRARKSACMGAFAVIAQFAVTCSARTHVASE